MPESAPKGLNQVNIRISNELYESLEVAAFVYRMSFAELSRVIYRGHVDATVASLDPEELTKSGLDTEDPELYARAMSYAKKNDTGE